MGPDWGDEGATQGSCFCALSIEPRANSDDAAHPNSKSETRLSSSYSIFPVSLVECDEKSTYTKGEVRTLLAWRRHCNSWGSCLAHPLASLSAEPARTETSVAGEVYIYICIYIIYIYICIYRMFPLVLSVLNSNIPGCTITLTKDC